MKRSYYKNKIEIEDLKALLSLLKTKLPIQDCFELLKHKKNEECFKAILSKLNQGITIEEAISGNLPVSISPYFTAFSKLLSFEKALELSIAFYDRQFLWTQKMRKQFFYPAFLFFFSLTGLYLFDRYGLDSIFSILRSFEIDDQSLLFFEMIRHLLRIFIYLAYLFTVIALVLVLFFKRPKRIVIFYLLVTRFFPNSIFHIYYSQEFISFYALCGSLGYKTKETMELLKSLKNRPIVSFLAYHIDASFLKGSTMKEAMESRYLDHRLSSFIKISTYAKDMERVLEKYVAICESDLERKMKRCTKVVQVSVYLLIGVMIVFIYQVLFLPMQAIGNF